jgi:hypothetical protein
MEFCEGKVSSGCGNARRRASLGYEGAHTRGLPQRGSDPLKSPAPWRSAACPETATHDHPFLNCSTKLLDAGNIWVVPPGPDWWQNRICIDIDFFPSEEESFMTNLRWLLLCSCGRGTTWTVADFHPPADRRTAAPHLPRLWRRGSGTVASYLVSHATRVPPCPLPVGCDTLTSEVQVCSSSAPYDAGHALWMSRGTPGIIRYWMVEDHENGARQRW